MGVSGASDPIPPARFDPGVSSDVVVDGFDMAANRKTTHETADNRRNRLTNVTVGEKDAGTVGKSDSHSHQDASQTLAIACHVRAPRCL